MYQVIKSGNNISFDIGLKTILDNKYLILSGNDNTYIRKNLMIDSNPEIFTTLLCDVLTKILVYSINKRTDLCIPCYRLKIKGVLDKEKEVLEINFQPPNGVTSELIKIILEEEFENENNPNSTRRIPEFL